MTEDNKQTPPTTDEGAEGYKMIQDAKEQADRIEKGNEKQEELIKRQESLAAQSMLGGSSEAGATEEKTEETPEEYAKKVINGEFNDN